MPPTRPCTGTTKAGNPCKASPLKGSDRCRRHTLASDTSDTKPARDEAWDRDAFLAAFDEHLMVSKACEVVGIHRSTAYLERQRNESFAVAWADVEERTVERLESEMFRRAHDGVEKMVVSAGKRLGVERQYSDTLLMFALKAKRPDRYRENVKVEHAGAIRSDVRIDLSKLDDADLDALERISEKATA